MDDELSLNEQHQGVIRSVMKFSKYTRAQSLKSISLSFDDIIESRLLEGTYTRDEVVSLVEELRELVHSETETELISVSHSNLLLLTQLFQQAENWHLTMTVDLSEVQNRELLEKVGEMERREGGLERTRLRPIAETQGSAELLRIEIERLRQDAASSQEATAALQQQLEDSSDENVKLRSLFEECEEELKKLKALKIAEESNPELRGDPEQLLSEYEKVLKAQLGTELETMKQQVMAAKAQLHLAEQELEKKFNETAAFQNMKTMISKKNEQVRQLRQQLTKYEDDVEL